MKQKLVIDSFLRSALLLRSLTWALAIGLAANIRIPLGFTPVPVTMQVAVVLMVGLLNAPPSALASLLTYVVLGIAGVPVFAGGMSGLAYLLGPTGGYLMLGFPMAAWLVSYLYRKTDRKHAVAISLLGLFVMYLGGFIWLTAIYGGGQHLTYEQTIWYVLKLGMVPFVWLDILKVMLVSGVVSRVKRERT